MLTGAVASDSTSGRAKYAAIAHANQSLSTKGNTQGHIYTDRSDINLHPGFIRTIESHEMLNVPLNMHLSGSLLTSLQWATQDPSDPGYPDRDGPTFIQRLKSFVDSGTGSIIGGVYAEHIMPYFEGEVNRASIKAFNELAENMFDVTTNDMRVMHIPERVFHTNTNAPYVSPTGALKGKPFEDILAGGYEAAYLDEVTHLHWWFYPGETSNPGWDANACGYWAGGQGNDEEPYHHKVHKINGVYCFMINDREDQSKFGPDDGGMQFDTRFTLLDKALSPDYGQLTLVFDDWEAFAGNSFASSTPNNNADQWHDTIRWAANHAWIEIVNLKDVTAWAKADEANWVIDQGFVYDKSTQTYEWLLRASEHSYDNWYYGNGQEENFFSRVPGTAPNGSSLPGTKTYGDLNTPGTLLHDAWQSVQTIPATDNLRALAEWTYSAMIYETAWHDEDANPDQYKSRNYQVTFNRGIADGNCDESFEDTTFDNTSGWALKLQGHARKVGIHANAAAWVADVRSGTQGAATVAEAKDVDDDLYTEYILKNDRVYACIERWGARVVAAFVYDPTTMDARQVVGVPVANPAEEHDGEGADNLRVSAFKDRYSTGTMDSRYVDQDYASTAPVQHADGWTFTSDDGAITKTISLWNGRDVLHAEYALDASVGSLYVRYGLGPNQRDLLVNGADNLTSQLGATYRGLQNTQGGAAFVVTGTGMDFVNGSLASAGWENRELPLVEQFETVNTGPEFSVALAFSLLSAIDLDGDGLSNEDELNEEGTDHENPDTDFDGIWDGYELAHFLDPFVNDANGDADTDGSDNLSEFLANTLASDPNSFFAATEVHRTPTQTDVTFFTAPERIYQIYFADVIGNGNSLTWLPFNDVSHGVGTWTETSMVETNRTLTDTFGPTTSGAPSPSGVRMYRVVAQPQ